MPPLLTARAAVQLAKLLMAGAAGALFSHTVQAPKPERCSMSDDIIITTFHKKRTCEHLSAV